MARSLETSVPEPEQPRAHAIIVGAGIAGLSAAFWLSKLGMSSTILEYHDAIAPGGHVIHIYGPGLLTLKRMNLNLTSVPYKNSNSVIKDSHGKEILRLPFRKIYGLVDVVATSRGDLALALAAALPDNVTIRFGARLDTVYEDGNKMYVDLEGGETIEADILIGADGANSTIRDAYWEGEKYLEDLGHWFATYDVAMDNNLDHYCQTYSASGHMDVLYAPRKNRVAAVHIWRDGHTKTISPTDLKYDVLRNVTSKKNSDVWGVLHAAEKAGNVPIVNRMRMVTLSKWSKKRVLLIGDAAHCLTPLTSQGAGMAIASAELLARELSNVTVMEDASVEDALETWEKKLRPSIERLQWRVRTAAPKFLARNKLVFGIRTMLTKVLGVEMLAEWQALGIKIELNLVDFLDVQKISLPKEKKAIKADKKPLEKTQKKEGV